MVGKEGHLSGSLEAGRSEWQENISLTGGADSPSSHSHSAPDRATQTLPAPELTPPEAAVASLTGSPGTVLFPVGNCNLPAGTGSQAQI